MLRRYFVYSCFCSLFSFRSSLLLLSKNTKRPKIFLLFLFGLLLLFALVCFSLFALFELFEKPKKILLCLFFPFGSCLKIKNTKNICRSSLVFVSLLQGSAVLSGCWFHIIIQATQVKSNNEDQ